MATGRYPVSTSGSNCFLCSRLPLSSKFQDGSGFKKKFQFQGFSSGFRVQGSGFRVERSRVA